MANTPDKPGKNNPKKPDDDLPNLPSWLRTDDWLGETPPPASAHLGEPPSSIDLSKAPETAPTEQPTEMIFITDDEDSTEGSGSAPLSQIVTDPDESILLNEELQVIGGSGIIAPVDEVLDLSTMPPQSIPKPPSSVVKFGERTAKSTNDPDTGLIPPTVAPSSADSRSNVSFVEFGTMDVSLPDLPSKAKSPTTMPMSESVIELPPLASESLFSANPPSSPRLPSSASVPELPPIEPDAVPYGLKQLPPQPAAKSAQFDLPRPAAIPTPRPLSEPSNSVIDFGTIDIDLDSQPTNQTEVQPVVGGSESQVELPPMGTARLLTNSSADDDDVLDLGGFEEALPSGPKSYSRMPKDAASDSSQHDAIGGVIEPTSPASGWLGSGIIRKNQPPLPLPPIQTGLPPGSEADIALPPIPNADSSNIFDAQLPLGTNAGGSALLSGVPSDGGSSLFNEDREETIGESNLFADIVGNQPLRPSQQQLQPNSNLKLDNDDAVGFDLNALDNLDVVDVQQTSDAPNESFAQALRDLPGSTPPAHNTPKKEPIDLENTEGDLFLDDDGQVMMEMPDEVSGSNLLGDRTIATPIDMEDVSGVNLADPDSVRDLAADSGPASSIFNKLEPTSNSNQRGVIDFNMIPMMGSSDDPTAAILPGGSSSVLGGPPSGVKASSDDDFEDGGSVFDVQMPKAELDSGMIDWADDPNKLTDRLGSSHQIPIPAQLADSEPDVSPLPPTARRGAATIAAKAELSRRTPVPETDEPVEEPTPYGWRRTVISVMGGLALGIGGMLAINPGGGKSTDTAGVAQVQQQMQSLKSELTTAQQTNEKVSSELKSTLAEKAKFNAERLKLKTDLDKANSDLTKEKKSLTTAIAAADRRATEALNDAKKATTELTTLKDMLATVKADAERSAKEIDESKKLVDAKTKEVDIAKMEVLAVGEKLKSVEGVLDPIIEKLKSAKLIDDKADRATALAALPTALKKAAVVSGDSSDTAKLSTQLAELRDTLKKQEQDAAAKLTAAEKILVQAKAEAEKQVEAAKIESKKSIDELSAKVAAADKRTQDEIAKALESYKKDSETKLVTAKQTAEEQKIKFEASIRELQAAIAAESKKFNDELQATVEKYEKTVESLRKGGVVPLSTVELAKQDRADQAFVAGTTAYFSGQYSQAEGLLNQAIQNATADARYWYFLGLTKYAQGRTSEATADFAKGAEWEGQAKPRRRDISDALLRVQGPARQALEAARP